MKPMKINSVNLDILLTDGRIILTSPIFQILISLVFLDIVSGYTKAIKNKVLDSKLSTGGLLRHVLVIMTVFLVGVYSIVFEQRLFGQLVTIAFAGSYGISLLENMEAIGIWIPPVLKQFFKQMKEQDIPIPNKGNALNNGDDVILK